MKRVGEWLQTYTGRAFYPFDPRPEDICIEDIAHALAHLCRFGGHSREFYSVAQHSVLVSCLVPERYALAGLLHDATEAYCGDLVRSIKSWQPGYRAMEADIYEAIRTKFDLPEELPPEVHYADNVALATEKRDLMGPAPQPWGLKHEPSPNVIVPLSPTAAKFAFERRFEELNGKDWREWMG